MGFADFPVSVSVTGKITIAGIKLGAGIVSDNGRTIMRVYPEGETGRFPSFFEIASLIGGSLVTKPLFDALGWKPGEFDASLTSFSAVLNTETGSLEGIDVSARMTLFAVELALCVSVSEGTITGGLYRSAPELNTLLKTALHADIGLPGNPRIEDLSFAACFADSTYSVNITLSDMLSFGPVKARSVSVSLIYTGALSASVFCCIQLGKTGIEMSAEYDPNQTGWVFTGGLEQGSILPVGELLEMLVSTFGVSGVPEMLSSLNLTKLHISYKTANGDFGLDCGGDLVISDTRAAASIHIALKKGAGQSYKADFSGEIEVAGMKFALSFAKDGETNLLSAVLLADGVKSASLTGILGAVSESAAKAIPGEVNIGFKQAAFVWLKTESEASYMFNAWLDAALSIRDMPLVGGALSGISAGVDDLQIGYASADIPDTGVINGILPVDALKIQRETLQSGVILYGKLTLGDTILPLMTGGGSGGTLPEPAKTDVPARAAEPAQAQGSDSSIHWFDLNKSLAGLHISRVGAELSDGFVKLYLDASLTIGPVTGTVVGLMAGNPLDRIEPVFGLDGIGIAYNKPPLMIAGFIAKRQPEGDIEFQLDGLISVKASDWLLTAFASYAVLKNGTKSFFAFVELDKRLGGPPAFVIEGVMGGMGLNYKMVLPEFSELIDFPLLDKPMGSDPQNGALAMLDRLMGIKPGVSGTAKRWLVPSDGFWIAAGVRFSSFGLVEGSLLAVCQICEDFVISVLGSAELTLPKGSTRDKAYVYIKLLMQAVLKPSEGVFSLRAELTQDSFVLSHDCVITGGFAFYLWFGNNPRAGEFVLTIGGYHPSFKPPDYYPMVPRLGFSWFISSCLSMKGSAYLALTPSCIMAGGSLEILFHSSILRAWFIAKADFLATWQPFSFLANISVEIGASITLDFAICSKTVELVFGANLTLWGTPLGGEVVVKVLGINVPIRFGSRDALNNNSIPLKWSEFRDMLPEGDICNVAVSAGLLPESGGSDGGSENDTPPVVNGADLVLSIRSTVPLGALAIGTKTLKSAAGVIDIRPMKRNNVRSVLDVKITCGGAEIPTADIDRWRTEAVTETLPAALWGKYLTKDGKFVQAPTVPNNDVVTGQLTGMRLSAPPAETGTVLGGLPNDASGYVKPVSGDAVMPLRCDEIKSGRFLPVYDEKSIGIIEKISGEKVRKNRRSLFGALAALDGVSLARCDDMAEMARDADGLFADAVMLTAGEVR